MTWDLCDERMQLVPAATVDQAGPLPIMLEPDFNILRWENFLRFPQLPTLIDIEAPPGALQRASAWLRWVTLALSILLLVMLIRTFSRDRRNVIRMVAVTVICASITVTAFYQNHQTQIDEERLQRLAGDLLHNVYRAFDYRGDEVIYDVLEKSVSGELLTDIYLETQRGLELSNQGGARVKVKSTTVNSAELLERDGNRLKVTSAWNVAGSVGHWGHVHQRTNGYRAELEISEIDGAWKLTGLEILEEKRL
jgi:hypothetical protein